jgi:hypothetical protein
LKHFETQYVYSYDHLGGIHMSLKAALFEMKEALINNRIGRSEEEYINQLEDNYTLNPGSLVYFFNTLVITSKHSEDEKSSTDNSKKINRKWTKNEINFLFQYINARQEEGILNITEILDEAAHLLNRGYQSVNYKYYSLLKASEKKNMDNQNTFSFTTISETEVPVITTEVIQSIPSSPSIKASKEGDLLDILSGLINNVEQLQGINLTDLLGSLLQLTSMAIQNQETVQQFERTKMAINHENDSLRAKLVKKEKQLTQEKKRNDQLQLEVSKLAKEIMAFNQLGDAAKIKNLKSYNQRLNYIIDGFGVVLQVGS